MRIGNNLYLLKGNQSLITYKDKLEDLLIELFGKNKVIMILDPTPGMLYRLVNFSLVEDSSNNVSFCLERNGKSILLSAKRTPDAKENLLKLLK